MTIRLIWTEAVKQTLIDLEARLRKNNLTVENIIEIPGEIWEDFEEKLLPVFQEKLGLEYRMSKSNVNQSKWSKQWKQTTNKNMPSTKIERQGKNPTEIKQA